MVYFIGYQERGTTDFVDSRCRYLEKLSEKTASKLQRELDHEQKHPHEAELEPQEQEIVKEPPTAISLPSGIEFTVAEPITDRKSVFIGRACRITHHEQVPQALAYLMADKRIARSAPARSYIMRRHERLSAVGTGGNRAAHPIINAWRCTVDGVTYQGTSH